jgi:hypothetical protein
MVGRRWKKIDGAGSRSVHLKFALGCIVREMLKVDVKKYLKLRP